MIRYCFTKNPDSSYSVCLKDEDGPCSLMQNLPNQTGWIDALLSLLPQEYILLK